MKSYKIKLEELIGQKRANENIFMVNLSYAQRKSMQAFDEQEAVKWLSRQIDGQYLEHSAVWEMEVLMETCRKAKNLQDLLLGKEAQAPKGKKDSKAKQPLKEKEDPNQARAQSKSKHKPPQARDRSRSKVPEKGKKNQGKALKEDRGRPQGHVQEAS